MSRKVTKNTFTR